MPLPTVVIVDAYSTGRHLAPLFQQRGYRCVHVQSASKVPDAAGTLRRDDFVANLILTDSLERLIGELEAYEPTAILAGAELGVNLADRLSEAMGVRTNGTALSATRRDKFRMIDAVGRAGLKCARQQEVRDVDSLARWYDESGSGRVVLKPVQSSGNDGVFFCDDERDVIAAFTSLAGEYGMLDLRNEAVLAQQYLLGVEYYVNTVSLDGVHYVCDVHSTRHLNVNGVRDLLGGSQLLPRRGIEQDQLTTYVFGVLDALGIRNGPAHTEVKLTEDGPMLIETASRVCGADLPLLVRDAIGESQLEWTVDAYVDPDRFWQRHERDYKIERSAVCVNLISPRSGQLVGYPKLDQIRELESFHRTLVKVAPGSRIATTHNDFTYPMLVHLLHPALPIVLRDYASARYLDGEGFYEIQQ
jgi:ATP-grasp domain-containing protein